MGRLAHTLWKQAVRERAGYKAHLATEHLSGELAGYSGDVTTVGATGGAEYVVRGRLLRVMRTNQMTAKTIRAPETATHRCVPSMSDLLSELAPG